jgi:putative transposase
MSHYRRYFVPGGTYFFTLVTERRMPLFADSAARSLLGNVMRDCFARYPLRVVAMVLLPDHLHAVWQLPPGDDRYSMRWRWIKREFTRQWLAVGGREQPRSTSRLQQRRRGVWQRRFWEHTIEDEIELESHCDYLHFNPVKHGYVMQVCDWPWSTFHRWVQLGHYDRQWGSGFRPRELPGMAGE